MTPVGEPIERRSYVVAASDPRRMSVALARYRITRPLFVIFVALLVTTITLYAVASETGNVTFFAAFGAAVLLLNIVNIPRTTRTLAARGYRPGSTIRTDWFADRFQIVTERAQSTHLFEEVRSTVVLRDAVAVRTTSSRLLLLLPEQLVPREFLGTLRAR